MITKYLNIIIIVLLVSSVSIILYLELSQNIKINSNSNSNNSPPPDTNKGGNMDQINPSTTNNIVLNEEPFNLNSSKLNTGSGTLLGSAPNKINYIISYGSYSTESKEINFSRISNINDDILSGIAVIDSNNEVSTSSGLLADQVNVVKQYISVNDDVIDNDNLKWKNIYTPSGFNLKDNNKQPFNFYFYTKDTDINKFNDDSILCCISFNFNFISDLKGNSGNDEVIISPENRCLSLDSIIISSNSTDIKDLSSTSLGSDSYDVSYTLKRCNTHNNYQKFIVTRYSWDKTNKKFNPDKTGLYASITHKSLYNTNYYLSWNYSTNNFEIKKLNTVNNEHIIWIFYPEVTITEANLPNRSWCRYNSWYQPTMLQDLKNDIKNFNNPPGINWGPQKPNSSTGKKVGNAILKGVEIELFSPYYEAEEISIVTDAIGRALGLKYDFQQIKVPVKEGQVIVPEEYVKQPNNSKYTSGDNLDEYVSEIKAIQTFSDNNYYLYGNTINDLKDNGFTKSKYIFENQPQNSKKIYKAWYKCPNYVSSYPEYALTSQNFGFVGEIGFTGTILAERFQQTSKYIDLQDTQQKSDIPLITDYQVKWLKKDTLELYSNTTTFSNDYFQGMKGTSTITNLDFDSLEITPFVEGMSINNLRDYLIINSGAISLKPSSSEKLGQKNLPEGKYTFASPNVSTNAAGKNLEINIKMTNTFVSDYSVEYPGTDFKVNDSVSIYINIGSSNPKDIINFQVDKTTGTSFKLDPIFEISTYDKDNLTGHDLSLDYGGTCILYPTIINKLQSNKTDAGTSYILYGGSNFKKGDKVIITATNRLNSLIRASFVFNVSGVSNLSELDIPSKDLKSNFIKNSNNLYSGYSLFTNNPDRYINNNDFAYYNNKVVFDLTTKNDYLNSNVMISPSQIGFIGVSIPSGINTSNGVSIPADINKYLNIPDSNNCNTLRDLFTAFDTGNSKSTLTKILNLSKEITSFTLDPPSNFGSRSFNPEGNVTNIRTNTKIHFLNSLQIRELNYGSESDLLSNNSNTKLPDNTKIELSTWIPYKNMRIYDQINHNPGPGIPIVDRTKGKYIDLFNYNNSQIIPYGIDNIYDKTLTLDQLPSF